MVCTDSILELTSGQVLSPDAFMGFFRMDFSSYTGLAKESKGAPPLLGRIYLNQGEEAARLAFLAPEHALANGILEALLSHLAWECVNRGALRFLAELDENSPAFESFRLAGFCVFTHQQIWRIPNSNSDQTTPPGNWQPLRQIDSHAIQSLYHTIVPPLVQGAECLDKRLVQGYGYSIDGDLLAFVEVISGPNGLYLNPVVHPNIRDALPVTAALIRKIQQHSNRPVYIAIRDYQSWLNSAIQSLQGEPSERKVMMVKHLSQRQRVNALNPIRAILEVPGTKTSNPFVQRTHPKK